MIIYSDAVGFELYTIEKEFFAESCILDAVDTDVYEIEVDDMVKVQIQYERDGLKVYKVLASQVKSFEKLELINNK